MLQRRAPAWSQMTFPLTVVKQILGSLGGGHLSLGVTMHPCQCFTRSITVLLPCQFRHSLNAYWHTDRCIHMSLTTIILFSYDS